MLPPLNEQHRIVEKIETLFARLNKGEETLREVQKLLAHYRQSVLKAAVIGQLTADWRTENARRLVF
ncbi:type I restriction enzyme, S subunit [Desulfonatronum thiosulfatophilum]|uniref:Type I restriction enzyme, S subunit n=1 Tax=Desulfonatronum thiosulfatophilum TaxID=617002 RepID=A0A1G6E209_9BACT|nr:type I restriction enzyme, S subunit [Desulfonatronum thiosulfatophilum]